jgi:hypothetical protein
MAYVGVLVYHAGVQIRCPATTVHNSLIGIVPGTPVAESASNSDAGGDYNQVRALPVTTAPGLSSNICKCARTSRTPVQYAVAMYCSG